MTFRHVAESSPAMVLALERPDQDPTNTWRQWPSVRSWWTWQNSKSWRCRARSPTPWGPYRRLQSLVNRPLTKRSIATPTSPGKLELGSIKHESLPFSCLKKTMIKTTRTVQNQEAFLKAMAIYYRMIRFDWMLTEGTKVGMCLATPKPIQKHIVEQSPSKPPSQ